MYAPNFDAYTISPRQGGQPTLRDSMIMRAEALSDLQNLGLPLSKISPALANRTPAISPIPGVLDYTLDTLPTRTKKCCKEPPHIERMSSEWYPLLAPRDLRYKTQVFGAPSRLDGRDPIAYKR